MQIMAQKAVGPSNPVMADGERAAYDAPYPEDKYKAGARMFPELVPTPPSDPTGRPAMREAENNAAAWVRLQCPAHPFDSRRRRRRRCCSYSCMAGHRRSPQVTAASAVDSVRREVVSRVLPVACRLPPCRLPPAACLLSADTWPNAGRVSKLLEAGHVRL